MDVPLELRSIIKEIRSFLGEIGSKVDSLEKLIFPPDQPDQPSPSILVSTAQEFHEALSKGGLIEIKPDSSFVGEFQISKNGSYIKGNNSTIQGLKGPALYVLPGVKEVEIHNLTLYSDYPVVLQIGSNDRDTQSTIEQVPDYISIKNVKVPVHRGKRAIEVNGSHVLIFKCELTDIFDPSLRDSQAIWIGNTPGDIIIESNILSAGSEVILSGGDSIKIPVESPTNVAIRNNKIFRPLEWKIDGTRRAVKNLIEIKNGHNFLIENNELSGCWKDAQDGYAFMLTPASKGSLKNITIRNNKIKDVSSFVNITGFDSAGVNRNRTEGINIENNRIKVSSKDFGGRGTLALFTNPKDVSFINNIALIDGTSLVHQSGSLSPKQVEVFTFTGNKCNVGQYSFNIGGVSNAGNLLLGFVTYSITGNILADAKPVLRTNLPENEYLDMETFMSRFSEDLNF